MSDRLEHVWWKDMGKQERRRLLRFYRSLQKRYGPFDFAMREHARAVTEAWWRAALSSEEAMVALTHRRYGPEGRKANVTVRERMAKRSGKNAETYNRLLARLMAMAVRRAKGPARWEDLPGVADRRERSG